MPRCSSHLTEKGRYVCVHVELSHAHFIFLHSQHIVVQCCAGTQVYSDGIRNLAG